ncbi:MAG: DUF2177 family protein [Pseudomonadota bacterium]|nr:DUF2177 family protein [Pseudomonadota bacterium]
MTNPVSEPARLSLGQFGIGWLAALVAILVLDGLWLGFVARDLYKREMGALLAESVRVLPAVVFYGLYPAALVFLTVTTPPSGWPEAALRGAVLGLAAYGAYDLTNLAIVRDWPIRISLLDWAWGGVIGAAAAAAAYAATWGRA